MRNIDKRLQKLENSAPIIDNLAAYVLWIAHGCQEGVRWDKKFKTAMRRFGNGNGRFNVMRAAVKSGEYCTYHRYLFGKTCRGRKGW